MRTLAFCALAGAMLSGCATYSLSPMVVADAPTSRVYWDHYAGEGHRIKVTRNAGQMGSLCMTKLSVDGRLAAEIGQGEAVVFKVSPGSHVLKASPSLTTSTCQTFYSAPQFHIQVTIDTHAGGLTELQYGFHASGLPAFFLVGG